ncbi:hypothetical protein DRJ54_02455 [Candidatus Acetothermia bacterium]|nr:MAG: hypothetical protein DRJ54_02455 [Candidatus Acetothermia bacterium]
MTPEELLPERAMAALARCRLVLRRPRGASVGGHPSPRLGLALEFADHRPYQPGDDFRQIDWAVYARQRRLVTKVYSQEVEAPLYLLLDTSRSMAYGSPAQLGTAARLAAALAFVAYRGLDRFGLQPFSDQLGPALPPGRGQGQLSRVLQALAALNPAGRTDFSLLRDWAEAGHEPGLMVVISDFLAPEGVSAALASLALARHQVMALQVLSPEERAPGLKGLLRLVDVETGRERVISLGDKALRAYRNALAAHNRALADFCLGQGIAYRLVPAESDPVEAVLALLFRRG